MPFAIAIGGNFDVALTDLGWPAPFSTSINGLIVPAVYGTTPPAKIYGSATLNNATLPAGNYDVTILGTPPRGRLPDCTR